MFWLRDMDLQSNPQPELGKLEQIAYKFLLKSLHIILDSRVPSLHPHDRSGDLSSASRVRKSDKWFNLVLGDRPAALDNLSFWHRNLMDPMIIDVILVREGSNLVGVFAETVIERWVVQYEYPRVVAAQTGENSALYKKTYKRSIILLRALYTHMRLLPAYKIFRQLSTSSQTYNFDIIYKVSSFSDPFSRADGEMMEEYSFTPVEAFPGRLCISVTYRSTLTEFKLEPSTLLPPRIITDYVGSPDTDPLRSFPPSVKGVHGISFPLRPVRAPSSVPLQRPHSWTSGFHRATFSAQNQPIVGSPPAYRPSAVPYDYSSPPADMYGNRAQHYRMPIHQRAISYDDYQLSPPFSPSPSPSSPSYISSGNPMHTLMRPETAPVSIPFPMTGRSSRFLSPNSFDPNRSSLPPLSPRSRKTEPSSQESPCGTASFRKIEALRSGEMQSYYAGQKMIRDSRDDSGPPDRPSTGTPAPWAPRLSVLARIPPVNRSETGDEADPIKPVYVGEFPQVVRDEQAGLLQKHVPDDAFISGGMEKGTSLAWIIIGNRLFIWNYLSPAASMKCIVLEIPLNVLENRDINSTDRNCWLLCVVNWESTSRRTKKVAKHCNSAGIVLCNQNTRTIIYWPEVYSEGRTAPVTSFASTEELEVTSSHENGKANPNKQRQRIRCGNNSTGWSSLNSLMASALPGSQHACVALACCSNGELWQFHCSPTGIHRKKIYEDKLTLPSQGSDSGQILWSKGYPRSLIWRFSHVSIEGSNREFFLLTDREIQCFSVDMKLDIRVSKLWSHEIIGTDGDAGIRKDLAGQKRIWPLDLQVDDHGKVITILVATFCKDRVSGSSYTQYSLLTMQYKSGVSMEPTHERILEKKAPIQVIIPKARVEDEDFLFSMRLRIGGKPSGSAIILSGDGTATVAHYYRNSTHLYQFDLPYDAGKVLDASVLPSSDDGEEGPWVVLTEKAGIWAIPEKAVVLGGVEPPERSLSRKGSSNERSAQEETRNLTFVGNIAPRRVSSEAWDAGERQTGAFTGVVRRTGPDEESETLLSHLFHDFLSSGQVDGSLEKLKSSGAFERDGETSVFARMSKSIVDTLAKHWTTTRGAEILAMAVVSTQLVDKQQKHKAFLQFLALSKCHEELCSRQRYSLQIILEHGEKLAGMIQLRELQHVIGEKRSTGVGSSHPSAERQMSGALWDLIQLVGERARRNTVLLMDRDNAEVFYSKVSDLEEVFYCLDRHLDYVISIEQPLWIQIQRACELSNACATIVREAIQYRNENHLWYPPPEGLTPWYCQPVVRSGMWSIASFMHQLLNETSGVELSAKSDLYTHLEVLTEVLLEAYAGAVTAKVERGEEHKGLLDEFWSRRDTLLDSLYQQVQNFVDGRHQDLNRGFEEQKEEIRRKLSLHLLSIAKQHECYRTLWRICCDLNDTALLRNLMHESMGPNGGFSYFVFKELYEKRQFSKVLRLGEEFPEELSIFLRQHQELLWLHEVFLNQFSSASEILHVLALSCDQNSISATEEQADLDSIDFEPKLVDRKRLLNLSKIAARAATGKDADSETKLKRIEADRKILKLQEEMILHLPTDEEKQHVERQLLRPEDLIKLCLKGQNAKLSLCAFDLFAWTSSSFRKTHRNLMEECWKNAADQDDWSQLYQASIAQGWSDEETIQNLRETMLFQASNRCYGPNAETFGEGFAEVMLLRRESVEPSFSRDLGSSVEAILMQHKDFPEAGKLMLAAITLGSVQDDTRLEEGPSPME